MELDFRSAGKSILRLRLVGGRLERVSGDDSWFDYGYQPISGVTGQPVSFSDSPRSWAEALAEEYRSGGRIELVISGSVAPDRSGESTDQTPIYAGWWQRAGALFIDGLICGVLGFVITMVFFVLWGAVAVAAFGEDGEVPTGLAIPMGILGAVVLPVFGAWVYYRMTMCRAGNYGQSVGKQALGIAVVRDDNRGEQDGWFIFLRQLLLRDLFFLALVVPLIVNYLWPLWDDENRALHDKIMKSHVLKVESPTGWGPRGRPWAA